MTPHITSERTQKRKNRKLARLTHANPKTWPRHFFLNQRKGKGKMASVRCQTDSGFDICRRGLFRGLSDTRTLTCPFFEVRHMKRIPQGLKCVCQHMTRYPTSLSHVITKFCNHETEDSEPKPKT